MYGLLSTLTHLVIPKKILWFEYFITHRAKELVEERKMST